MKNLIHLITPVVFMLFFVNVVDAQSETKCDLKECTVKCCSTKTCAELVSEGICTPKQVAECKAKCSGDSKVASSLMEKDEVKATSCVKSMASNSHIKKDDSSCTPVTNQIVVVEKLEKSEIKPVTKEQ